MSDSMLEELASEQKVALYKNHPLNKDIQKQELNACLTS
jgi:hypothetical protein